MSACLEMGLCVRPALDLAVGTDCSPARYKEECRPFRASTRFNDMFSPVSEDILAYMMKQRQFPLGGHSFGGTCNNSW